MGQPLGPMICQAEELSGPKLWKFYVHMCEKKQQNLSKQQWVVLQE